MAVTSCKLRRTRQSGQKIGERTVTHVYVVICSAVTDGPLVAENYVGVPALSAQLSGEPDLIVDSKSTDTVGDSGMVFEVTVVYKTIDPDSSTEDPLTRSKTVEFSPTEFTEDTHKAFEQPLANDATGAGVVLGTWSWGNAVVNSAGQSFDPSVAKAYYDQTIVVTRNVAAFDWETAGDYQDTVNSDTFTIVYKGITYEFEPGQARIAFYGATGKFENGESFFEERIEIQIRKDGWSRYILDQGLMELNNGDTPPKPIRDAEGNPVVAPVMLDGHGAALENGEPPIFLKFKLYKDELPFGSLNLDL
jgi:hypothetical protein